jgi:hypothetical protein
MATAPAQRCGFERVRMAFLRKRAAYGEERRRRPTAAAAAGIDRDIRVPGPGAVNPFAVCRVGDLSVLTRAAEEGVGADRRALRPAKRRSPASEPCPPAM